MKLILFTLRCLNAWLIGVYEQLFNRAILLSYPPAWMRFKVSGTPSLMTYAVTGRDTVEFIESLIGPRAVWGRVFDYGCGCGRVLRHIKPAQGYEPDASMAQWCCNNLGLEVTHNRTVELPVNNTVDTVLCISIISHTSPLKTFQVLNDIFHLLTPGGTAIITTHRMHKRSFRRSPFMPDFFSTNGYSQKEFRDLINTIGDWAVMSTRQFEPSPNQMVAIVKKPVNSERPISSRSSSSSIPSTSTQDVRP